jgi:sterol desaturase/sphingolipid hydroxylase (fatty acid hydroxylase superfamily)
LDYLFGTAVKTEEAFPQKYGVVGDYMPEGFVKQQLFPFVHKSNGSKQA